MKVQDLIKQLKGVPKDTEVCICDIRKNIFCYSDDEYSDGIESSFEVKHLTKEEGWNMPFVALIFKNDDYTEECEANEGSLLFSVIEKQLKA